jgi:hypothetical protein
MLPKASVLSVRSVVKDFDPAPLALATRQRGYNRELTNFLNLGFL